MLYPDKIFNAHTVVQYKVWFLKGAISNTESSWSKEAVSNTESSWSLAHVNSLGDEFWIKDPLYILFEWAWS